MHTAGCLDGDDFERFQAKRPTRPLSTPRACAPVREPAHCCRVRAAGQKQNDRGGCPTSRNVVVMDTFDLREGETANVGSLRELKAQAEHCKRCDLYKHATQTVFGEGPMQAEIVLIGEQPGDKEDLAGRPFVGPAGAVLNESLSRAGIDRERCYITNTVKHFKFTQRGKRRLHSKPNAGEIRQCAWWLRSELKLIEPKIIVALGATAAGYLVGKAVRITRDRGTIFRPQNLPPVLVTIHPSYILRIRDRHTANAEQIKFVHDLNRLKEVLGDGRS